MAHSIKVVVSDFHLGKGHFLPDGLPNPMEDFHQDYRFKEMLTYYSRGEGRRAAKQVELVLNGDFFDYLAVDIDGRYPDAMFEAAALAATDLICRGHPLVIDGLREFARTEGCRIRYHLGNHDPAIVWPSVQQYLREHIDSNIEFCFDAYEFDDVRIEHGHQREVMHAFAQDQLVLPAGPLGRKEPIINFPFGCFFVTGFVNRARSRRHYIGAVVPFRLYLRWAFINDFWFAFGHMFLVSAFFIKMRFFRHPSRFSRFSKTLMILKDIFRPPQQEKIARRLLEHSPWRILIMGHNHEAAMRLYPHGKQYLNCGTWTEFTSFDPSMLGHQVILSYVYLEQEDGQPWRAELKRWFGEQLVEEALGW